MGWCSATEIMDATLTAATKELNEFILGLSTEHQCCYDPAQSQEATDALLRPVVTMLAKELRDRGWDCVEESDHFDRFRQEMLGLDHNGMIAWYRAQLEEEDDPARVSEYNNAALSHVRQQAQSNTDRS